MRGFKRKINPIFVEDDQYDWGKKRTGRRLLICMIVVLVVTGLLMLFFASPA